MRTYQISVNDKEYTVEIDDPNASPATVQVNGKTFKVTIAEQASTVRPALSPEIEMDEPYVPVITTTFVDTTVEVESEPATGAAAAPAAGEGLTQVIAPMPGKIMDISAQVGDQVKQGQTLCNLEAMKMKSPIRSATDGTIAQVLIGEGQNVSYGDVLFTLE